jgi:homoserine O-acetyltransferase/O-succinyltransferase
VIVARQRAKFTEPLPLACGRQLPEFEIAYETYGSLNSARSNAILVCHGLTADQHAAGKNQETDRKPGWWDAAIGPGKAFDTEQYYVLSTNVLGSFGGSTSPASIDPQSGRRYGMRFPVVTIGDMVNAQARLADRLGIECFQTIVGGCMGGFQALEWMVRYPHRLANSVVISATPRTTTHNIALWAVFRQAICSDPRWNGGDYYDAEPPDAGIGLMAMFGALFWVDRDFLTRRFGLRRLNGNGFAYSFEAEFEVEAFLRQIARNAPTRLDANALLYLTRAIDYFDLGIGRTNLAQAFSPTTARTLLVSYKQDWRYPTAEMREIADALSTVGASVEHCVLDSAVGHGAFLYDFASLEPRLRQFLSAQQPQKN